MTFVPSGLTTSAPSTLKKYYTKLKMKYISNPKYLTITNGESLQIAFLDNYHNQPLLLVSKLKSKPIR